jgi:hypothetical protein
LGDDFGIHDCTPGGDLLESVNKRADVADVVFQQAADAAGVVGKQLAGVETLDVLGEGQDRQTGQFLPGRDRGRAARR